MLKDGPWKSTGLLRDASNIGGMISDSPTEVEALFSLPCAKA